MTTTTKVCTCGAEFTTRPGNKRTVCFKCAPKCQRKTVFMLRPNGTNMTLEERKAAESEAAVEQGHAAVLVRVKVTP